VSPEQAAVLYYVAESPQDDSEAGVFKDDSDVSPRPVQQAISGVFRGPVVAECRQALYKVYLQSVLCAGGAMDRQATRVSNAVRNSSAGTVWFTR
jgi:hypothetical protein